jgi:hypothetical protein
MDPWEVMPAPHGPIYPWQESGKTEWQCVLILGVSLGGKSYFCERPRSPMATRGATRASGAKRNQHEA